jgi:transposase
VEDGTPLHRNKTLSKETEKVKSEFPHPLHSPDLSPIIENMWEILKKRLRRRRRTPSSEEELWEAIQEEWEGIPIRVIHKLVQEMPKRVAHVKRY